MPATVAEPRTKQELRRYALQLRSSLGRAEPAWATLQTLLNQVQPGSFILTYLPFGPEQDPAGLITDLPLATTRTPAKGADLTIHPLDGPLEQHAFGYLQPAANAPELDSAQIGLVLVPGLAFDRRGGRLGYGKGYYDRLLGKLPAATPRVGLVRSELIMRDVPMDSRDVPMTHLLTESGLIDCATGPG